MAKAGTAYVEVIGDFSKLRRQLAQEMAGRQSLHIGSDFDSRGFLEFERAKAKVVRETKKDVVQTLAGDLESAPFFEFGALHDKAEREARDKVTAKLGFAVDKTELDDYRATVERIKNDIKRKDAFKAHLGADFDESAFAAFNRESEKATRNLKGNQRAAHGAAGGMSTLTKAVRGFSIPGLSFTTRIPVAKLALFGKLAVDAAGGIISLTSALAPMTGLLGAIGPLATAAAQGFASIKLATSGVGDAVSAAFADQDKAATGSTQSLQAQETAAEGVREAQLSLTNAQRTAVQAQTDLTLARKDATREIEDMRRAVRDLALQEEGASLSLREAKEAFAELSKTGAGDLEIEQAALRIKEARSELQATRQEARRARQDLGGVDAGGGVKGMPQVVAARQGLADANRGVVEAEREVANAMKTSAQAMKGTSSTADALAQKMAALSPPARKFAQFIIGLRPQVKRLQSIAAQGLFPGVEAGIRGLLKNMPAAEQMIRGMSKELGKQAKLTGELFGSDKWGKDLEIIGRNNERTVGRLGEVSRNLADAFRNVTVAAGPMVDRLTKWVVTLSQSAKEAAHLGRENGKLQKFFEDAGDTFFKVTRIVKNLALSLFQIGKASRAAFGNDLLDSIAKGAKNLREWTKSAQGQKELRSVFRDIGDSIERIGRFIRDISDDFRRMKAEGKTTGEALSHIFLEVLTGLVAQGAVFGAKMAVAFAKGFAQADIWGKLLLGGLVALKAAPLLALFRKQGVVAGAAMGQGVATGAAAGIVGGGAAGAAGGGLLATLRTKLLPAAKRVGLIGVGLALADNVMNELSRRTAERSGDVFEALEAKAKGKGGGPLGILGAPSEIDSPLPGITDIQNKLSKLFGGEESDKGARRLQKALKGIVETGRAISSEKVQKLREEIDKLGGVSDKAKDAMRGILDASQASAAQIFTNIGDLSNTFDRVGESTTGAVDLAVSNIRKIGTVFGFESKRGANAVRDNMEALSTAIRDNMKEGRTSVRDGFEVMRDFAITNSRAVAGTAQKNFGLARSFIRDAINDGTISTKRGMKLIRELWFDEMAFYGFSKKDALNIRKARSGKSGVKNDFSKRGEPHRSQRGGPIDLGAPVGDTVPAMLERGEYVLNRKAVKQVGRETLDQVNFKRAPRFASGGIVALGRKLQDEGYEVGEHPAFGGVDPGAHVPNSHHLSGEALDVSDDSPPFASGSGEPGSLDRLYSRLKGMSGVVELLWRVANHFDHLHVAMQGNGKLGPGGLGQSVQAAQLPGLEISGPGGGVQSIVERGLKDVHTGAQMNLDAAAAAVQPGVDLLDGSVDITGGGSANANRRLGKRMAAAYGWTGAQWVALEKLWTGESGWENVMNTAGSGATGIPQALPGSKMASEGADWRTNPATQIAWGLKYIKGRYTDPIGAYNFWLSQSPHWYKEGGQVGYVGDSLGVGTAPKLRGRIGELIANVAESRTSQQGLKVLKGMLGKKFDRYIWDLGSNDPDAGAVKSALKEADRATGDKLLLAATLNGKGAKAKNSALRALAGGDINLFEWAKRSEGLLGNDGLHPTGEGYSERAAMMAGALKAATSRHKGKGGDPKLPKLTGTLKQNTRKTAKALANTKDKKRRAKILARYSKKLKGLVPQKLLNEIAFQGLAHDRYSDFADSAAEGDVTDDNDVTTKGLIQGKNEGDWLAADLTAMFKMRNKLIKAKNIITGNKTQVDNTFKWVSELLKGYSKDGHTPKGWDGINPATDSVEKWNKQQAPKRHRQMKKWRDRKGKLPGTREFNTFTGKVQEVPKGRVSAYKTLKDELSKKSTKLAGYISTDEAATDSIPAQLQGLQGFGPPQILSTPWPRGTIFGGDILTAQDRILELFKVPPATTDDTTDDISTELLQQLLREANLRTAVSERQFDVLRNFPPFGGQFATGGVVPGPTGAPRTVIAHGGETITPAGGQAAAPNVYVNIDGKVSWLKDFVTTQVQSETRKMSQGRVLPGRGGGN